ncbi:MAG: GGDEF domain-containing protein [Oscillospiraceae bacterium]|nr:GGDEF domain-containing protein [Oscillospiraceae bacterium]
MGLIKNAKENGLSLKIIFRLILGFTLAVTVGLLFMTYHTIRSFRALSEATEVYIVLEDAATGLMNASDYLTEEAQCYTVLGDRMRMENYFHEADETRRRERAVETMESILPDSAALQELKDAMSESLSLMDREYYAMRLMLEAAGDSEIPAPVRSVTLSAADAALSAAEKRELAAQMMHDEGYYSQKNRIREHLGLCIEELKTGTRETQMRMERHTHRDLIMITALIVFQSLAMVLMLWLTTRLGINPLLKAVDHIRQKQSLPIMGSHEFRYLAETYNSMYSAYEQNLESLSYKASHDELTGVWNRAGYDLIRRRIDPETTAFILIDADGFKQINDECGHGTGDRVLVKIAGALRQNFRSDDYVCRIGGDEFVVLMLHVTEESRSLIEEKVRQINRLLSDGSDGLPPVSISAGISFCRGSESTQDVFREADEALYHVKEHGKKGLCFYQSGMQRS